MTIRIRARARHDLDGILDYSVATHGETVADSYLRMIGAVLDRLADDPALGVARDDLATGLPSLPTVNNRQTYYFTTRIDSRADIIPEMAPEREFGSTSTNSVFLYANGRQTNAELLGRMPSAGFRAWFSTVEKRKWQTTVYVGRSPRRDRSLYCSRRSSWGGRPVDRRPLQATC